MIDVKEKISNINFNSALVVGGAGFIGSHIVDFLVKNNVTTYVFDDLSSGRMSNIEHNFDKKHFLFFNDSVLDFVAPKIVEDTQPDVIFYLAAIPRVSYSVESPVDTNNVNVGGLVSILNAAKECENLKKFVFSSSSSVYGGCSDKSGFANEKDALYPKSPYALQKKIGEEYCKLFSEIYEIDTVCLRYFNVFGPRQYCDSPYASVISSFCESLKEGLSPVIYGNGKQTRDFCFVDNVVFANILSAN